MLISFLMSAALATQPQVPQADLAAALAAEHAAATACIKELDTSEAPGSACRTYNTRARELREIGGDAALQQSSFQQVQQLQRMRWALMWSRKGSAVTSVSYGSPKSY